MKKRGQSEIIYLVLTIGIAFVIAAGVFTLSRSMREDINGQLGLTGLERTALQLEGGFLKIKGLADSTNEQNVSIRLQIPTEIGEQRYAISGKGTNTIELRTIGNPSILKLLEIRFWNVTASGFVSSGQGFVRLELQNSTSVLLK